MRETYAEEIDLLEKIINHEDASDVSRTIYCGELAEFYHLLGSDKSACHYLNIKSLINRDILLDEDIYHTDKEKEKYKQEINEDMMKADKFIAKGEFSEAYLVYAGYYEILV